MWIRSLAHQTPFLLVAEERGRVVGFSAFGPCRDETADANIHELWALYVLPDHLSQGFGKQLWLVSCAEMTARGATEIQLWVLEGNCRAINFYTKAGFKPETDSSRPLDLPGHHVNKICFTLRIPGASC
ncbi:N-acetyltransferase family protein [Halomonas sp. WWR20]